MSDITFNPENPRNWDELIHRLKRGKFIEKATDKFFTKMFEFGLSRKGIPTEGRRWKYSHPRRTGETARNWITSSEVSHDRIIFTNNVTVNGIPLINILNASKKHKGFWDKAKVRLTKEWDKKTKKLVDKIAKDLVK